MKRAPLYCSGTLLLEQFSAEIGKASSRDNSVNLFLDAVLPSCD